MVLQKLSVTLLLLSFLPLGAAEASDSSVAPFFFKGERANQTTPRDTARLDRADRARLLQQGFACNTSDGRSGQAHCTEQADEVRRELRERTRRNHEIAKQRWKDAH